MADRDQILADFHAFTGIEDFEHSVAVLEQHDWNLMEAVQNTMAGMDSPHPQQVAPKPEEDQLPTFAEVSHGYEPLNSRPTGLTPHVFESLSEGVLGRRITPSVPPPGARIESDSAEGEDAGAAAAPPESAFSSFPGTSGNYGSAIGYASTSTDFTPIRLLNFKIEYRDRSVNLTMPDNETVEKVKELIQIETMIPKDKQNLCGWISRHDKAVDDKMVLRDLKLPKENVLYLSTSYIQPDRTQNGDSPEIAGRLSQKFQLIVKYKDTGRMYPLNFLGTKTIKEVKSDVYTLIDVPVRHQVWTGWPAATDDDENMTLAGSGVTFPCHSLEVTSSSTTESKPPAYAVVDISSDEEFEDANYGMDEDALFDGEEAAVISKQTPLMPENSKNEGEALEAFVKEFSNRYGDVHPVFYIGDLEDALKDSLQCKARERKLLAVYLHHDNSIQANVFCSQLLCSDAVIDYLSAHFLLWAWDLTSEANKARLLTMCTKHFGSVAANTVRSFKPDELPLLLIISRNRSTNEVMQVIRGNTSIDELLQQLMHCEEVFRQQVLTDIEEEDQRDAREAIKFEQEQAYQASLSADRAKEELRRQQEEEEMHLTQQMEEIQKREEEKRQQEDQEKEAMRLAVANKLPDEPPKDCSDLITTIRFRGPEGEFITRRFLAQHPLQVLLNFVLSEGFHLEDYKVLSTFPRRDLTQEDPRKSLKDHNLYPQETLVLEERS